MMTNELSVEIEYLKVLEYERKQTKTNLLKSLCFREQTAKFLLNIISFFSEPSLNRF